MNLPQHPGQTAYIVGRGPSLLTLQPGDFGPGPVIALNAAILHVRTLQLPNPLYYQWKDGCVPHGLDWLTLVTGVKQPHVCKLPPPIPPEVFITSKVEGDQCLADYPLRHVIDVEAEFGLHWSTMSSPIAVEIAHAMGATSLVMYGQDAWTSGGTDTRRWMPDGSFEDDPHAAYYLAGKVAQERAGVHGLPVRWGVEVPA